LFDTEDVKKKPVSKPSTRLNLGAELSLSKEEMPDPLAGTQPRPPKSISHVGEPALEVKVTELDAGLLLQEASSRTKAPQQHENVYLTQDKIEGILFHPFILPLWRLIIGPTLAVQWKSCLDTIPTLKEKYWGIIAETPDFILPSASNFVS
jgi:hypothetical protein